MTIGESLNTETRTCAYPGCTELIGDQLFNMCETCRQLDNLNRIRLVTDPFTPQPLTSLEDNMGTLLTQMTGAETLEFCSRLEYAYIEMCKVIRLRGLKADIKRPFKNIHEQVADAREQQDTVVNRAGKMKKREKSKAKLGSLLNMSDAEAEDFMNTKIDF